MNFNDKVELKLTRGELWLLDWVLCYPMQQPQIEIDSHMRWHDFRVGVWQVLSQFVKDSPEDTVRGFMMNEADARILLCLVPTSHVWGVGEDYGHSLKTKIYKAFYRPIGEEDDADEDDADEDDTKGGPEGGSEDES